MKLWRMKKTLAFRNLIWHRGGRYICPILILWGYREGVIINSKIPMRKTRLRDIRELQWPNNLERELGLEHSFQTSDFLQCQDSSPGTPEDLRNSEPYWTLSEFSLQDKERSKFSEPRITDPEGKKKKKTWDGEHQSLEMVSLASKSSQVDMRPVWVDVDQMGMIRSHLLPGSWFWSRLTAGLKVYHEWPTREPATVNLETCRKQQASGEFATLLGMIGVGSQDCPRDRYSEHAEGV